MVLLPGGGNLKLVWCCCLVVEADADFYAMSKCLQCKYTKCSQMSDHNFILMILCKFVC